MTSIIDAAGNALPAEDDLGEGAEDMRDDPVAPVKTERQVDKALKDSFDCSDPLPANPGAD